MPRIEWSVDAVARLDHLIRAYSLPVGTKQRVRRSLFPLQRFPLLGAVLRDEAPAVRFLLGPWRWMIVVYAYLEDDERVVVLAVEDARSSSASRS